jgi:gliding motility-associated-like protein
LNSGSNDGTGTSASFYFPIGITIDALGNLYVADTGNNLIRKVTLNGVVTTIAGNGSTGSVDGKGKNASINAPIGITLDPNGNLYVTQGPGNKIRKIDPQENVTTLTLLSGSGSTTESASLAINVTVLSQPQIISTYANETVIAYPGCNPVLPNYAKTATFSDNCSGSVLTVNQTPAAGTPLAIGSPVNVTLTVTDASGAATMVTFPVSVVMSTEKLVSFTSNPAIFAGTSVQLNPKINGDIVQYYWSPATGLNNNTIEDPTASPVVATTYTLTVTTAEGCTASADVTVIVLQQVVIPNAFTPNGDGVNDLWDILHLDEYPNCTVDIYSRAGQRVFHSIGYGKPWEGKYNGSYLPTGAYYYVIDLKSGGQKFSGEVTIIK